MKVSTMWLFAMFCPSQGRAKPRIYCYVAKEQKKIPICKAFLIYTRMPSKPYLKLEEFIFRFGNSAKSWQAESWKAEKLQQLTVLTLENWK